MDLILQIHVTVKNDGLTQDASRDELSELVQREIRDAIVVLPWVIDHHFAELVP